VAVKQDYGDRLVLHGGVDARLWEDEARMEAYVRRLLPVMKAGGGYIFSTDHTVPESASLATFGRIVSLARELGRY
jgi:uroporphyrinogen decarboxylase